VDVTYDRELAALLALAQQGDRQAYERFMLEVSSVLRRFIARRTRSPELVEDILQETLLTIHRSRHSYLPGRPVGPWLYAMCEHRMADFHRRRRRIERVEASETEAPAVLADEPRPEASLFALEALGRLRGRQRRVIELLKLHDLSVREVAARVGMSESAVKVTAFRGYQEIRKMVGGGSK
jgi:RNA polymerase sigma-70 factor (ECF subfamily)